MRWARPATRQRVQAHPGVDVDHTAAVLRRVSVAAAAPRAITPRGPASISDLAAPFGQEPSVRVRVVWSRIQLGEVICKGMTPADARTVS